MNRGTKNEQNVWWIYFLFSFINTLHTQKVNRNKYTYIQYIYNFVQPWWLWNIYKTFMNICLLLKLWHWNVPDETRLFFTSWNIKNIYLIYRKIHKDIFVNFIKKKNCSNASGLNIFYFVYSISKKKNVIVFNIALQMLLFFIAKFRNTFFIRLMLIISLVKSKEKRYFFSFKNIFANLPLLIF